MAFSMSEATKYDIQKGLLTLLSEFSLLNMVIYGIPQSLSIVLSLHPATLCGVYKCNVISGELSNFTWKICHVPMPCWVIILKPNINMLIVQSGYFISRRICFPKLNCFSLYDFSTSINSWLRWLDREFINLTLSLASHHCEVI